MKRLKLFIFLILILANTILVGQNNCGITKIDDEKKSYDLFVSMLSEVSKQSFKITNNINDIPAIVKEQLDCFFNKLDMANYNEKYNGSCIVDKALHSRGLTFLAKNENYLLISYGGSGGTGYHLWIEYNENGSLNTWFGSSIGRVPTNKKIEFVRYLRMVESSAKTYLELINLD